MSTMSNAPHEEDELTDEMPPEDSLDLAIVGMAGRFPGARNLAEYWRNLAAGVESIRSFSEQELLELGVPREAVEDPSYVRAGALLDGIDLFDAAFFGYSPREAELMDPQQRIFLECCWQALESAGYDPERIEVPVGIYAGTGNNTYLLYNLLGSRRPNTRDYLQYATGNDKDYVSTRVSYKLDLRGPSLDVQTACSTSLVAVHLACQALLTYQCDMALAGGVSIFVPQLTGYYYQEESLFSPDGHCRAFDAGAQGTIFGNGAGVVVLKRLADALAEGDTIHAVVKATAINNDGALKLGFTAPSVEGQAQVIEMAQVAADIDPRTISYVETHGTGTTLGDPIEVTALRRAFGEGLPPRSCGIGSVKTNIGHLDAAAGIAGLLKVVLSLVHRRIPPSLHFERPNPKIDFESGPFYVNAELAEWPANAGVRRAGVSAFGLGGTNAHTILEEAPPVQPASPSRPAQLLVLSAKTLSALDTMSAELGAHLEAHPELHLGDVAYTLQAGRPQLSCRRMLTCRDGEEAAALLASLEPERVFDRFQESTTPRVAFMFPGGGAQHADMGLELYRSEEVFRREVDTCLEIVAPQVDFDLAALLYPGMADGGPERAPLERTSSALPALFTTEYALARQWMSWGIEPAAMIGHSMGEYVAACLAGVMTVEDALSLVVERGRLFEELEKGAMVSVPLPEEELLEVIGNDLSLAAVNSPSLCVVSGPVEAIAELGERLAEREVEVRRLHIDVAAHSQMVESILPPFRDFLGGLRLAAPQIPFVSNLTGTWITESEAMDPEYWVGHLRHTVRFGDGVAQLAAEPHQVLLEVGPGSTLTTLARRQLLAAREASEAPVAEAPGSVALASMRHPSAPGSDVEHLLNALGRLWLHGARLDPGKLFAGEARRRVPLPGYAFERQRYWVDPPAAVPGSSEAAEAAVSHDTAVAVYPRPDDKLSQPWVAPRTDLERQIAEIWQELLGIDKIGIHDSFFELGGHSLLGTKVVSRVRETWDVELRLRTLFESPTVAALAESITEALGDTASRRLPPIHPAPRDRGHLPLSLAQQRLWFLDQMAPGNAAYNTLAPVRMTGPLDLGALQTSLDALVRRHESLRTTFETVGGEPVQVIHDDLPLPLRQADLRSLPASRREPEAWRLARGHMAHTFDLSQAPLIESLVIRLGDEEHALLVVIHHIVSDGWSNGVLVRELAELYEAFSQGMASPLPELSVQFGDFAVWQREWLQGQVLEERLGYWRRQLAGDLPALDFPTDRPRPPIQTFRGRTEVRDLAPALAEAVKDLAGEEDASLFMTLLAAFQILLYRHTGQEDILVGTPVAGRDQIELEHQIGFFINTLVLRTDLSGRPTFRELLRRARDVALQAYAHQEVPFEMLVEDLKPPRDPSRTPIFQIFINEVAVPEQGMRLPEMTWTVEHFPFADADTKFDLTLYIADRSDGLQLNMNYNSDLFDQDRIHQALDQLEFLLEQIVERPDEAIDRYSLVTPAARVSLPDPAAALAEPAQELPVRLVLERAERQPEHIALVHGARAWSYGELAARSLEVARELFRRGAEPGTVTAVSGPRCPELIASLVGVLRAGGAVLPLDRKLPAPRRRVMLHEAGARFLVLAGGAPPEPEELGDEEGLEVVPVAAGFTAPADAPRELPEPAPDDPAYVFFTSGTSGVPKGILGSQKGLSHFLVWQQEEFAVTADDRSSQLTGLSFDVVLRDIFLPLASGATLCLPEDGEIAPESILPWLEARGITVLHTVPSLASSWLAGSPDEVRLGNLRWVFFAGEPLPDHLVRRWRRRFPVGGIVNLYGPTETTLAKCYYRVPEPPRFGIQPVGRALPQAQALVLGPSERLCGVGEIGEIVIRTPFCSLGYLQASSADARRFQPNPFRDDPRDLIYHTGDVGRFLPDGTLEILGRIDDQVKIRGMRVEPAEVQACLLRQPGVGEAFVAARQAQPGDLRLVAYLVADGGAVPDPDELRQQLKKVLPDYMVPAAFVVLDALPLNANGKVDRRALPEPEFGRSTVLAEAPRSPVEKTLATIWAEVLGLEGVGIHDDFFDLGGHSLLAIQLLSRVRRTFGVDLSVREVFTGATVAVLAEHVARALAAGEQDWVPEIEALPRPASGEASWPLSFAQQRLWFLDQLAPGSAAYNMAQAVRFEGHLDARVLAASLGEIVRRHESLRTRFDLVAGEPVQVVAAPPGEFPLPTVDLCRVAPSRRAATVEGLARREASRPFDLRRGPLFRVTLLALANEEQVVLVTMHHIVSDGWSMGILVRELGTLYTALTDNALTPRASGVAPSPLPELEVQYADFAQWQRRWLSGEVLESEMAFWRKQLGFSSGSGPAVLELPTDHPRPAVQSFAGQSLRFTLPGPVTEALRALGRDHGVTLYMLLLAAFQTLLARYTGQTDITVGTPVAGRRQVRTEELIGFFVNTLVHRTDLAGNPRFTDLLSRVRQRTLAAFAHQDVPFEKLVAELQPGRDLSHTPLYQVVFVLQNAPMRALELPQVTLETLAVDNRTAKFDLTLALTEPVVGQAALGGGLAGVLEVNRDLFNASTAHRLVRHFVRLVEALTADPKAKVGDLSLLTPGEQAQVLREWSDAAKAWDGEPPLAHEMFAEWARRRPAAPAVISEEGRLSYGELEARANRLAHHLRSLGVGPEELVAMCTERTLDRVVGILAVLKAGGAYVSLDPTYPRERLEFLLHDTGAPVILTQSQLRDRLPQTAAEVLVLDAGWDGFQGSETSPPAGRPTPQHLAYVVYTSGSTGKPKGVAVPHAGLTNLIRWHQDCYSVTEADRGTQVASPAFDASIWELWPYLTAGASSHIPSEEVRLSASAMVHWWAEQGITLAYLPTPLAEGVLEEPIPPKLELSVRALIIGGDRLHRRPEPGTPYRLMNHYGPAEYSIVTTVEPVAPGGDGAGIPAIGRAIDNTGIYVLDRKGRPVPIGVVGEPHVDGMGLARGYLGRPERTAASFLPNPWRQVPGERMYRTGDLVRWLPDGNLDFLGRLDNQVKLRGLRIELGEIEAVLAQHPDLRDVAVRVWEDSTAVGRGRGHQRLTAWVVPREGLVPSAEALQDFLRERLPAYMVPASILLLEALPLTLNGKVDREALPAPVSEPAAREGLDGPLEEMLAGVWGEVLQLEQVGRNENFFDLGGHSLLMARLHGRLQERLGRPLSMLEMFQYPTIRSMADHLRASDADGEETAALLEARVLRARRRAHHALGAAAAAGERPVTGLEIAVVGMAGRFPRARDLEDFWQRLRDGVECVTTFSDDELLASGVDPAQLEDPHYVRAGAILEDAELFDAEFFGYSPREAEIIDPQQRIFLETAWHALEDAGYDVSRVKVPVGVYGGSSLNSYFLNLFSQSDLLPSMGTEHVAISNSGDFLCTRVSYKLDIEGPSVVVQSACSTSLVAVHTASQALLNGECEMALAGGVSVTFPQKVGYLHHEGGLRSPDGHCRPFDAGGRGLISGQGVGVVVLKRLEDAARDGDAIRAVILGSAVNNDGSLKAGFTAPRVEGQARVIRTAQELAAVEPGTIRYVEAHGTGTELGDPIEIAGLTTAFGDGTGEGETCAVGSVKSNIGHLDAAAGVAGLIKTVLALEHDEIPPSLNFEAPNPQIDFASGPFFVNTALRPWPVDATPRRAGVSSFGLGGTNAHAVLEEAPALAPGSTPRPWQLLLLSARTPSALDAVTANLARHLRRRPELDLADVAYTTQVGRRQFEHRRALVCQDRKAALEILDDPIRGALTGQPGKIEPAIAFMFSGLGDHGLGMGRGLYRGEALFREHVDHCAEVLEPHLGLDLRTVLAPEDGGEPESVEAAPKLDLRRMLAGDRGTQKVAGTPLEETRIAQPALFVLEYALARLWMSWGVRPQAMIGYSLGEYVAACLAGVMSLDEALVLVADRARMIQGLPAGAMLAVPLGEEALGDRLDGELSLSAVNGPALSVVSGPPEAVERFAEKLGGEGHLCRRLETSHAFHSTMMEPLAEAFLERVRQVDLAPPEIPWLSNVTGTWIQAAEAIDPAYWVRHLCETVRFADGVAELWREPGRILLEVGPGQTLGSFALQHPAVEQVERPVALASLSQAWDRQPDAAFVMRTLGQLWLAGVEIDWPGFYAGQHRRRVPLPGYPFARRRFFIERREPAQGAARPSAKPVRDLAERFFLPSWESSVRVTARRGAPERHRWLVLTDACGLGERLAEGLGDAGHDVVQVSPGDGFAKLGEGHYRLDPAAEEGWKILLDEIGGPSPQRILHLWSLTSRGADAAPARALVFDSLVVLAQAFARREPQLAVEICVVTNGLVEVGRGDEVIPEKALLLGPARVIPQEIEKLGCRVIDIDPEDLGNGLVGRMLSELEDPDPAPLMACRGMFRWLPTFQPVRLEAPEGPAPRLRDGGVYLVTGGLGGLGLAVAGYLGRKVGARLVLTGRSGLPERSDWPRLLAEEHPASRAIRAVEALEEAGSEVLVRAADVADEARMRAVVEEVRERFGRLDGVFHLAGVPGGGLIQLKTRDMASSVLRPKVEGTRVLEAVLADAPPELVVLFSSLTSTIGGIGQVDYAAASAYLEAFAQRCHADGSLGTVTVDWSRWQWDTLGTTPLGTPAGPRGDVGLLSFDEGIDALDRILAAELPHVIVSTVDPQELVERHQSLSELLASAAAQGEAVAGAQHPRPVLGTPFVEPETDLEAQLVEIWKTLLGIDQVGTLDHFFELGGHSLLGLQVVARVRDVLGVELSLRSLFDTPTVKELAASIEQLRGTGPGSSPDTPPGPAITRVERSEAAVSARVDELSEDAMDELLVELLAKDT